MKFEYWQDPVTKQWNYHLVSDGNHEVLMSSNQGHENKQDMLDIVYKIHDSMANQPHVPVVDITTLRYNQH